MADHELIDESERERFAGTSAMNGRHDRDGDGVDDRREAVTGRHDRDGDGVDDRREPTAGRRRLPARPPRRGDRRADRPARFNRDDVAAESDETGATSRRRATRPVGARALLTPAAPAPPRP